MNRKVLANIKLVARDKKVQEAVVSAMFSGCEVGSDLWEYLESDPILHNLSPKINAALFGPRFVDPETPEDEKRLEKLWWASGAVRTGNPDYEVVELLLKEIKKNLFPKNKPAKKKGVISS